MERNVPKLRFKEFNDEWKISKVGEITSKVGSGKTPKGGNSVYVSDGIMFIRSQNVLNGKLSLDDVVYISEEENDRMKSTQIKANDVLINITGASIGRCCKVTADFKNGNLNQHVCIIRPNKDNSEFIMNYMISDKIQKQIFSFQAGGNREGLNFEQIKGMTIGMPSIQEQERIANFLTKVDRIIEKQDEKVKKLEKFKKGMMQKIFSQEIRFKDENGEEYPEWEEARLNNVLSIPEKIKTEIIEKDKLLTVKLHMQGIKVNKNVDTLNIGATVYYKRKAGQFIYGKQNFFNGAFGIVPEELDGYLSSGDIPALNINRDRIIPEYLINYIGRTEFYKKTENLSSGTGSKRIHEKTLLEIVINIPCVAEQERIANFLSNIDLVIDKENKKLEELKRWKKGLLQQMFV